MGFSITFGGDRRRQRAEESCNWLAAPTSPNYHQGKVHVCINIYLDIIIMIIYIYIYTYICIYIYIYLFY